MRILKKLKDKLSDGAYWLETYCWWLPMVIGILAIVISVINLIVTIGAR